MEKSITICTGFIASPLHDKTYITNAIERIKTVLFDGTKKISDLGLITSTEQINGNNDVCDGYLLFILTGGTEHIMLNIRKSINDKPMIFLAHSKANSLPALLETAPILDSISKTTVDYIGDLERNDLSTKINKIQRVLEGAVRMSKARIGLLGGISPWLVYSKLTKDELEWKFGVELIDIPLARIYEEYEKITSIEPESYMKPDKISIENTEIEKAHRLYYALKKINEKEGLDAFTIKCFDIINDLKTTACLPLALFNSKGIIAGCEGDVPATIAMMISSWATGEPAFMANPADLDKDNVLFAHCTAPIAMAEQGYELKTHFESGKGVGVAVKFKDDADVTIVRLSPGMEKIRIIKGKIIESAPSSPFHCRSQLRVKINGDPKILLEKSMGNHHVITYGDNVEEIALLGKLLGIIVEKY